MKRIIVFLLLCCMLCVPAFAYRENSISGVFCGNDTYFVLMDDGKLIAWGNNASGEIPSVNSRGKIKYDDRYLITSKAKSLALGPQRAFLIDSFNTLYGWGNDGEARLLCGSINGAKTTDPIKLMDSVCFVSCGDNHNAAITLDGTLFIWGMDTAGSLGLSLDNGSVISDPRPVLKNVSTVCCHGNDTAAIAHGGDLYAWGEDFGSSYPLKLASGICDIKRGGGNAFILLNKDNEILLLQGIISEDGKPSAFITAPIASNVTEITDYGYIRDDGTLWMCQSGDGNSFIPASKNVSLVNCRDMRYRAILSKNTLHTENYEFDSFKNGKTYKGNDIDLSFSPKSGGLISSIIFSLVLCAAAFIVIEKPPFYLRLRDSFLDSIKNQLENEQVEQDQQTQLTE